MRSYFILLLLFAVSVFNAPAQSSRSSSQPGNPVTAGSPAPSRPGAMTYQLGTRSVVVPYPDGFLEASTQSDAIARLFTTTEAPENEMLAVHLPAEVLAKVKRGEESELSFYTKISVLRRYKALTITDNDFAGIVASFTATSDRVLDIDGPEMKKIEKDINSGLSELSGENVDLKFDQPINLGYFQKTKDVFSTMLVLRLKNRSDRKPLLCATSFVKVNQRLLFVYTYRKYESSKDIEILQEFTRGWIKQILAAN